MHVWHSAGVRKARENLPQPLKLVSTNLGSNKEIYDEIFKTRLSETEHLPEDAIDTSEIPELDDEFWENAQPIVPENYLQIEHEILEWFKEQGKDYHTRINTVLRAYMETHR